MTDNYVSKQAAIDIVVYECGKWTGLAKEISKQLKQLPSADVVPVVRCKDCKFRENDDFCTGRGSPYQLVPDDGFCDKGERKELEHERGHHILLSLQVQKQKVRAARIQHHPTLQTA